MTPYEAFVTRLKVSIVAGLLASLPIVFTQLWKFISPGLYSNEKEAVLPLVTISVGLFLIGACFAYYLVIPFALDFFLGFRSESLRPMISIGSYISFFLSLILIFGFVFDLPVVLVGLMYLGILKASSMRRQRKLVVVLAFVVAAILTPTVDVVTQCLLAVPLWLLYEISIIVGSVFQKQKEMKT